MSKNIDSKMTRKMLAVDNNLSRNVIAYFVHKSQIQFE